ncbi:ATP-binding cassette, subfamily B [Marininema mesophilum]|uniref:ATP-binding cassette, subfamily B n=1 Tax=Marininema mesophilum TaxID=1048340 RepID=A0A1H3AHW4_9BACL|nr:ABC transporter ATP-binding protein [Marininema mesophilum]SDX29185.1 ATP-binding cassette, subfamily B [Marininema mesophilum]
MNRDNQLENVSIYNFVKLASYIKRIFTILWSVHPLQFVSIIVLTILQGVAPTFFILASQFAINQLVSSWGSGFHIVINAMLVLGGVMVFNELCNILRVYVDRIFEVSLSYQVDLLVMQKASTLHLSDFEDHEVQDQIKRVQNESNIRVYQVFKQVMTVLSGGVTLVSSALVLFAWHWWAAVLILGVPIIFFPLLLKLGEKEFKYLWKRAPKTRELWYINYIMTRDLSFKEVKLYQLGPYLIDQYQKIHRSFIAEDKEIALQRRNLSFLYYGINYTAVMIVIHFIFKAAYMKQLMIGNVVGYLQAINLTLSTARNLTQEVMLLFQNNLFLEQLFTYLDMKVESPAELIEGKKHLQSPITQLELRNLSFQYPNTDKPVLKGINLQLHAGETLAIVGPNGSGKSTLIKILTQMYNQFTGEYLINRTSIRKYDSDEVNRRIGGVFQDFVQYEMPLRHNIGFGDVEKIDDDLALMKAAEKGGLSSLVHSLPKKLDTQLGKLFKDGHQLSGGQWQRVAIARAYLRDADICLFDEPSSFLDPQAEHEVFEKFKDLVRDRIGIFITHRLSSVRYADRIIVMDQGQIVEMGSHDQLINLNGLYKDMFTKQAESYLDAKISSA